MVGGLTAACVMLCAAGLVTATLPRVVDGPVTPASSDARLSVPDQLYAPSKWLGTLSGTPLVAVTQAERGTCGGSGTGIVGVSAVDGGYGFLDLQDRAAEVSLSPVGERLAYWVTGTPSGDPNTGWESEGPVTGLVVRDLRSGDELRHEVETEHGISPGDLVWTDTATLVFDYAQFAVGDSGPEDERGAASGRGGWWWNLEQDEEPRAWPWEAEVPYIGFWAARDGRVIGVGQPEDALVLLDPQARARTVVSGESGAVQSTGSSGTTAYGPDGRVAILDVGDDGSARTGEIRLGRLEPGADELVEQEVLGDRASSTSLLGWRDGDLLVSVLSDREEVEEGTTLDVMALDPATAEQSVLVRDVWSPYGGWDLADGLLETAEVVDAVEPPSPWDPRWVAAAWALAGAVVLVGFGVWRRRGRP